MPPEIKYVGWAITAAAAVVYIVMVTVTLPHLAALAGGRAAFDLRPFGYDFATAQDLLARLGTDGAAYYENLQHRLDSMFPLLFCLTLIFWMIAAAQRWQGHGLPLGSAVLAAILATAVFANAADLGENVAVSTMLAAGSKALTPRMAETAELFTLAKTFFSTIAMLALVVLVVGPWVAPLFKGKKL